MKSYFLKPSNRKNENGLFKGISHQYRPHLHCSEVSFTIILVIPQMRKHMDEAKTLRDLSDIHNQKGLEITFKYAPFKSKLHDLSTVQYQLPAFLCKDSDFVLCAFGRCAHPSRL